MPEILAEVADDPRRRLGADALDHPAGKVGKYFRRSLGHHTVKELRLKLLAVAGMGAPPPRYHQLLTHHRQRNGANHRHILSSTDIQAKHRVAVFIILVHHRADGALKDLHFLLCQVASHFPNVSDCSNSVSFMFIIVFYYISAKKDSPFSYKDS